MFPSCYWSLAPSNSVPGIHLWYSKFDRMPPVSQQTPFQCSTPISFEPEPVPKYISGRASYLRTRLAFYRDPQLIQAPCSVHWFGPPTLFTAPSPWPWVDRPVSGLKHTTNRPIQARFHSASTISMA